MKLTKSRLKQLIKEELDKILKEENPDGLKQQIYNHLVKRLTPRRSGRKVGTISNLAEIFEEAMRAVSKDLYAARRADPNFSEMDVHNIIDALKKDYPSISDSHMGFYPEVTIDELKPYLEAAASRLAEYLQGRTK
tara:strand:+ start:97 stop:504 length:408 start_codon:yes stop_codon:yes gene_type:complete